MSKRTIENQHWNKTRSTLMKGAKTVSHSSRRAAREQVVRAYAPPNEHNGWRVGE